MKLILELTLLSDASFGRGDGIAGVVDSEIEYNPRTGLPLIKGRTIKGLLVEECANFLFSLGVISTEKLPDYKTSAASLFGFAGSDGNSAGKVTFSDATLPKPLTQEIEKEISHKLLAPQQILESLTAIRSQTSVDYETGAPITNSLRSIRVLLHGITLISRVDISGDASTTEKSLLAACILGLHRGGSGRNRGRGKIKCRLFDEDHNDVTNQYFNPLEMILSKGA
jgi:hypothetical protein